MPVKRRPSARTAAKPKAEKMAEVVEATDAHTNARAHAKDPTAEAQRIDRIAQRIRDGSSVDAACWREGIDPDAVRSTMRRHPDVRAIIEGARAEAEDERRAKLDVLVAEGKPTAGASWMLERLHRGTFHLPTKIAMGQDPDAGPVQVERAEMTEAQIRDRVRLLAEKIGSGS